MVGERGKVGAIDTERGRMLHYADKHRYDHVELTAPYSPDRYFEAIADGQKAGYGCLIVDSFSHEWAGDGGCLDMHEAALERMSKGDDAKAERMTALAWREPKRAHKRMMQKLLQLTSHLILCFRAEQKLKVLKTRDPESGRERTQFVDAGWVPICEKHVMYEATLSVLMSPEKPGTWTPIKLPDWAAFLKPDKQLDENDGAALANWARGESKPTPSATDATMGVRDGAGTAASTAARPAPSPFAEPPIVAEAKAKAKGGRDAFVAYWKMLTPPDRAALKPHIAQLEQLANDADASS